MSPSHYSTASHPARPTPPPPGYSAACDPNLHPDHPSKFQPYDPKLWDDRTMSLPKGTHEVHSSQQAELMRQAYPQYYQHTDQMGPHQQIPVYVPPQMPAQNPPSMPPQMPQQAPSPLPQMPSMQQMIHPPTPHQHVLNQGQARPGRAGSPSPQYLKLRTPQMPGSVPRCTSAPPTLDLSQQSQSPGMSTPLLSQSQLSGNFSGYLGDSPSAPSGAPTGAGQLFKRDSAEACGTILEEMSNTLKEDLQKQKSSGGLSRQSSTGSSVPARGATPVLPPPTTLPPTIGQVGDRDVTPTPSNEGSVAQTTEDQTIISINKVEVQDVPEDQEEDQD